LNSLVEVAGAVVLVDFAVLVLPLPAVPCVRYPVYGCFECYLAGDDG
jgi:hypothetical protein